MERVDLIDGIRLRNRIFILNPANEWQDFPEELKGIVNRPWSEIKYFDGDTLNPEINTIPNNCGGIYLFCIKPNVIPDVHLYLAYIGRAQKTPYQNLRKRVKEYATEDDRPKICELKRHWGSYLYLRYLPMPNEDNNCIKRLEKELIKAILPPFNDRYPEVYNQAVRAAF